MKTVITNSPTETLIWAHKLADKFKGGEVVSLEGDLGAGKTVVVKGMAEGFGVKEVVNSPTFVLMKVYPITKGKIQHIVHVDAYRLSGPADLMQIGLADYLGRPDSVVLIEWGDKVKSALPEYTIHLRLKSLAENKREIKIN